MKTYTYCEHTELSANFVIRMVANEEGIEGCVEPSGDPNFPFACVWRDVDDKTYHKVRKWIEEYVGPE